VLSPLSAPKPATAEGPDPRTSAQRRGDALIDVMRAVLGSDQLGEDGGSGAAIVVTTDHDALVTGIGRGTLDDGSEIPVADVRRLACDALIIPALLGTASQPLDIGRATRVVPAGMRRAVIMRDRHCTFPGCEASARSCEAHHIVFWANLGPTCLDNLALLCGRHHQLIHRGAWRLSMGGDGRPVFHAPPSLPPEVTMADPTWRVRIDTDYSRPPAPP